MWREWNFSKGSPSPVYKVRKKFLVTCTKLKHWAKELTLWKCPGIPGGAHCWKGRWDHVGDRRKEDVHVLYLSNSTTVVLVSLLLVLVFSLNPLIYAQPFLWCLCTDLFVVTALESSLCDSSVWWVASDPGFPEELLWFMLFKEAELKSCTRCHDEQTARLVWAHPTPSFKN